MIYGIIAGNTNVPTPEPQTAIPMAKDRLSSK
jgi:hypothetical protein